MIEKMIDDLIAVNNMIIECLEKDQSFDVWMGQRNLIFDEIQNGNYSKEEFKLIAESKELMANEKKLKDKLLYAKDKVKTDLKKARKNTQATRAYSNNFNFQNSNMFNRKL